MTPAYPKPEPRKPRRLGHNSTLAAATHPIATFSPRRRALYDTKYFPKRATYLEAHEDCELRILSPRICTGKATEIHHLVQRSLDPSEENLLNEEHWRASCHECNAWVSDNSAEARARGLELDPKENR